MSQLAVQRTGLFPGHLSGKVAVVTGGGQGIGRETVRALAWLGAKVVIADILDCGIETERVVQAEGGTAVYVKTDVADEDEVGRLAIGTRQLFGRADILINDAVWWPVASVLEMDAKQWDRVMGVNLRGAFLMCKAFLPDMLAVGEGVIINLVATEVMPFLSAYSASKEGGAAFSRSLAGEVGDTSINVIGFNPGFVDTPGLRSTAAGLASRMGFSAQEFMTLSLHPAYEGAMPPQDAAAAIAYLAAAVPSEYHGEIVTACQILERCGFLHPPLESGVGSREERIPAGGAGRVEAIRRGAAAAEQLQKIVVDTDQEFNLLPFFVRPMARQRFKGKSGRSCAEWIRSFEQLEEQFKRAQMHDPVAEQALRQELARWQSWLDRLIHYYHDRALETEWFTRDDELLRQLSQSSRDRVQVIRALSAALEVI